MGWIREAIAVVLLVGCAGPDEVNPPEPVPPPAPGQPVGAGLVINEVVAAGAPDWFEVVNRSSAIVELSTLMYVDNRDDYARAQRFPDVALAPHARYVQTVSKPEVGFAFGKSDGLYIYGFEDHRLIDGVEWHAGASPAGGSLARVPDAIGGFVTVKVATRGQPN